MQDLHVPHTHSCSSLFPKKAEGLTTAGDTQLWPSHGCSSLFLKLVGEAWVLMEATLFQASPK